MFTRRSFMKFLGFLPVGGQVLKAAAPKEEHISGLATSNMDDLLPLPEPTVNFDYGNSCAPQLMDARVIKTLEAIKAKPQRTAPLDDLPKEMRKPKPDTRFHGMARKCKTKEELDAAIDKYKEILQAEWAPIKQEDADGVEWLHNGKKARLGEIYPRWS